MDEQETPAAAPGLTLQNLRVLAGAIELGSQRGAWKAAEMAVIGTTYNVLIAFLRATEPVVTKDVEAPAAVESTNDPIVG